MLSCHFQEIEEEVHQSEMRPDLPADPSHPAAKLDDVRKKTTSFAEKNNFSNFKEDK